MLSLQLNSFVQLLHMHVVDCRPVHCEPTRGLVKRLQAVLSRLPVSHVQLHTLIILFHVDTLVLTLPDLVTLHCGVSHGDIVRQEV